MMSKRAKILIVVDALPAGGTERQIVELFRGFKGKDGFMLGLCVLKPGGHREMEARRYAHFSIPVRQRFEADLWTCFSLLRWVRRYQINLFHSFGARSDWVALILSKLVGKPVINGSIRSARPKLNRIDLASRLSMPWADWVVSNSYAGLAAFGLSEFKKASVIHNGIDPGRFDQWKDEQGEPGRLCMVANFSRKKDQASLILALLLIRKKIRSIKLTLVGRGERRLETCRNLIRKLGLYDVVDFITDCNCPERYIAESQIGILISSLEIHGEGISNAMLEYMAMGKPVIATDCGGNREVVSDAVTGILISDNSPQTIAGAVIWLLEHPETMKRMGRLGRKRVYERFNIKQMTRSYEKLYNSLLGERERKSRWI